MLETETGTTFVTPRIINPHTACERRLTARAKADTLCGFSFHNAEFWE